MFLNVLKDILHGSKWKGQQTNNATFVVLLSLKTSFSKADHKFCAQG